MEGQSELSVIGVSPSEPHTSVTALRTRVCIRLWTDLQIFHEDRYRVKHVKASGGDQKHRDLERRPLKFKYVWLSSVLPPTTVGCSQVVQI